MDFTLTLSDLSLLLPTKSALLLLTRHAPSCRVDACTTLSSIAIQRRCNHRLWSSGGGSEMMLCRGLLLSDVVSLEEGGRQEE